MPSDEIVRIHDRLAIVDRSDHVSSALVPDLRRDPIEHPVLAVLHGHCAEQDRQQPLARGKATRLMHAII